MKSVIVLLFLSLQLFSHGDYWKESVETLRLNQNVIHKKTLNNNKSLKSLDKKIIELNERVLKLEKFINNNYINTPINKNLDIKKFKN